MDLIADPFSWDWSRQDRSPIDWLLPRASDLLFAVMAATMVLGVLEMLYSVIRMDRMNNVRTKRVATLVGFAMITRFLHGAILAVASNPTHSAMPAGDDLVLTSWLGIMYTFGLTALVLIVAFLGCLYAIVFLERGLPVLLPGNLQLRLMYLPVIGSMFMDITNAQGTPRSRGAIVLILTSIHCSTFAVSTSQANDLIRVGQTETSSDLSPGTLRSGLLDTSIEIDTPSRGTTPFSRQTYVSLRTVCRHAAVALSSVITMLIFFGNFILLKRVLTREHGVTKLVSFACLLTGLISLATSVGVTLAMHQTSNRRFVSELGRDALVDLGTTQYAAGVLLCFAVVFEGIVGLGGLRVAEADLQRLLPRAIYLGYVGRLAVLGTLFIGLAGAADVQDPSGPSPGALASKLATGLQSTRLPLQTYLLHLPWPSSHTQIAIVGSLLSFALLWVTFQGRHRLPAGRSLILKTLHAITVVLVSSTFYILSPKTRWYRQARPASKLALAATIAPVLLSAVTSASEIELSAATYTTLAAPTSDTTGTSGVYIACAAIFTIWILLPSLRGYRHSGLALETLVTAVVGIGFAFFAATAIQTAWLVATGRSLTRAPTATAVIVTTFTSSGSKSTISSWLVAAVLLALAASVSGQIYGVIPGATRTSTVTMSGSTRTMAVAVPSQQGGGAAHLERLESWHRNHISPRTLLTSASPFPATEIETGKEGDRDPRDRVLRPEAPSQSPGATRLAIILALLIFSAVVIPAALAW